MARTVTITWTLTAEEHAVWLSQARVTGYSVGQYIYLLAALHLIDDYPVGRLPGTFIALRHGLMLARWQRNWRQHGGKR